MPLEKPIALWSLALLLLSLTPKQNKCNIMINQKSQLTLSFPALCIHGSTRRKVREDMTSVWCQSLPSTMAVLRKDLESPKVSKRGHH